MPQILQIFILLPLLGAVLGFMAPVKKERTISFISITTAALHLVGIIIFIIYWMINGSPILDIKHFVFFQSDGIEIFIDFYFDRITAVFAFVGSAITLLVAIFSKFYLHRDDGFKRFYSAVTLFFLAYNIVIFAGNFETLFLGWEILGICSFLLIGYYRDRYLPVKNSLKVISVYRLGDICLILTMWMSHQLWHENITFFQLSDLSSVQDHLREHNWYGVFIAVMIVIAAATKSAQFPFSSWLPRAMEGPTTSSAIFYGSLSVHLGVFLLLRTYPYWESLMSVKIFICALGLITSIVASGIASVQSTVKTQIAYSSVTQIGLMFIEVALGWHVLALIHFTGNAFLRTYQLLVSPSVLSYEIHNMVFNFKPQNTTNRNTLLQKWRNTFYILSVKEYNLDTIMYRYLWRPFKIAGMKVKFLSGTTAIVGLVIIFLAGLYIDLNPTMIPQGIYEYFPALFALTGLLMILNAFAERSNAIRAWIFIIAGQLFITLSVALFHESFGRIHLAMYFSGTLISSVVGYICLRKIAIRERGTDLHQFYGHAYEYPGLAFVFLLACLGLIGFPFTPTFIGVDLLFSHIHKQELMLIVFVALSFIFMELAVLRIYARTFLGQHIKAYHPIAYRSS